MPDAGWNQDDVAFFQRIQPAFGFHGHIAAEEGIELILIVGMGLHGPEIRVAVVEDFKIFRKLILPGIELGTVTLFHTNIIIRKICNVCNNIYNSDERDKQV